MTAQAHLDVRVSATVGHHRPGVLRRRVPDHLPLRRVPPQEEEEGDGEVRQPARPPFRLGSFPLLFFSQKKNTPNYKITRDDLCFVALSFGPFFVAGEFTGARVLVRGGDI